MSKRAVLALEDGSIYRGYAFGAEDTTYGEVVFNTSMTGYQEMLTDPSYAGQILVLTYPLIGNYGINLTDDESREVQVRGLVVREDCATPSHWHSSNTLNEYVKTHDIPGLSGIDVRALTRKLRSTGVMMGILSSEMAHEEALEELKSLPRYNDSDFVRGVSTEEHYVWQPEGASPSYEIVVIDCGLKYNILRILRSAGCRCTVVSCDSSAEDVLALNPDGILISPGPGDPAHLHHLEATTKKLLGKKPIMGICLGHQLIARALGADTFKLKFGHRGGNHPVLDIAAGQVHITAQNHGYAVDPGGLKDELEVSHINLHDRTVEGLVHKELPIVSIQYHAEASPGPRDNVYLFNRFFDMLKRA
jgi:carbamoyl-phosphate synthase small subunit